jgi:hypothetical protein
MIQVWLSMLFVYIPLLIALLFDPEKLTRFWSAAHQCCSPDFVSQSVSK